MLPLKSRSTRVVQSSSGGPWCWCCPDSSPNWGRDHQTVALFPCDPPPWTSPTTLFAGRVCLCGRLIDPSGHHHAACARTGVLRRRGFALESATARISWTSPQRHWDARRLEVVVDSLPLFVGVALVPGSARNTVTQSSLGRVVVFAMEVGRISRETSGFITELARARARSEIVFMRKRAEQAWRMRWCGLFGCGAA